MSEMQPTPAIYWREKAEECLRVAANSEGNLEKAKAMTALAFIYSATADQIEATAKDQKPSHRRKPKL
jgi:hypothetical protein